MNKYIKIKMIPTKQGVGGSFITQANFKLDNIEMPFIDITVKIDTGCSISTIPVRKLNVSKSIRSTLKLNDIRDNIKYYLSYGIETGGEKHKVPELLEEKMQCPAMKFEHNIVDFSIGGVDISNTTICLNYDRNSNILIGMDILKLWDIHIGTIHTGETIFLACPKEQINHEYLLELENTFGISTIPHTSVQPYSRKD